MLYRMQSDVGDGTDEDYQAGVQFCIDHRWLEPAGRDRCRATPLGIAKIRQIEAAELAAITAERARGTVWFKGWGLTLRSRRFPKVLGWTTFFLALGLVIVTAFLFLRGVFQLAGP
jgi:hypothetical protein